jgi:hypothetical protein
MKLISFPVHYFGMGIELIYNIWGNSVPNQSDVEFELSQHLQV